MDEEPINDLALLKTSEAIELGHWIALPMCFERTLKKHSLRTTFSCCGLGSTSDNRNNVSLPKTLKVRKTILTDLTSFFENERNCLFRHEKHNKQLNKKQLQSMKTNIIFIKIKISNNN